MFSLPLMALWQGWAPPPVTFQPSLNLRSRLWVEDNSPLVGTRARIGLEAHRLGVGAKVSLQVVREWLQQPGPVVATGGTDSVLADGWISVEGGLSENIALSMKLGRQPVHVDDGRLVGSDDFSLTGRYLDALQLKLELAPLHFQFFNARRFDDPESDPLGLGVNILVVGAGRQVDNLDWLVDAVAVVDARHTRQTSSTAGIYGRVEYARLRARAEGYLQDAGSGVGGLMSLRAGWIFGNFEGLRLDGSLDLATGQSENWAAWQPVLGDSHREWGRLDVFADPGAYATGGLGDLQLGLGSRLLPALSLDGKIHRFWAPLSQTGRGTEGDLELNCALSPLVAVQGGGGYLLADPGGRNHGLGWVELDATF